MICCSHVGCAADGSLLGSNISERPEGIRREIISHAAQIGADLRIPVAPVVPFVGLEFGPELIDGRFIRWTMRPSTWCSCWGCTRASNGHSRSTTASASILAMREASSPTVSMHC